MDPAEDNYRQGQDALRELAGMHVLLVGWIHRAGVVASAAVIGREVRVTRASNVDQALGVVRAQGADLVVVDVDQSVVPLLEALRGERLRIPVVACGSDRRAALSAIRAGACAYVPLSADRDLSQALLIALAGGCGLPRPDSPVDPAASQGRVARFKHPIRPAALTEGRGGLQAHAPSCDGAESPAAGNLARRELQRVGSLVGRTVAEVERDLILDTLAHCHGNRTHAARILGISIRTLRNKLSEYGTAGIAVPGPGPVGTEAA